MIIRLLLMWLIMCSQAWAGNVVMLGGGVSGSTEPPTYVISESFDASTGCNITADSNCSISWTVGGGTATTLDPSCDSGCNASSPLSGTYSIYIDSSASPLKIRNTSNFSGLSEVWGYFTIYIGTIGTISSGSFRNFFMFSDSAGSNTTEYGVINNGGTYRFGVKNGATVTAGTSLVATSSTVYHVWVHYKAGSGSNGITDMRISQTDSKPTSAECSTTTGTNTASMYRIYLVAYDAIIDNILFDKIRIDDVEIGSNPS